MQLESILFYIFSSIALVSALMVIFAQNPVHSILFLILTFCNSSFIMFLIGAEFLGLMFIMVKSLLLYKQKMAYVSSSKNSLR